MRSWTLPQRTNKSILTARTKINQRCSSQRAVAKISLSKVALLPIFKDSRAAESVISISQQRWHKVSTRGQAVARIADRKPHSAIVDHATSSVT